MEAEVAVGGHRHPAGPSQSHLLNGVPPHTAFLRVETLLLSIWPLDAFNLSNEHSGLIYFRMDWLDLLAVQGTLKSLPNTTVQKHQFFSAQLSLQSNSHVLAS